MEVFHLSKNKQEYILNEASLDQLRDALLNMPRAKKSSGGKEIAFRCPFCGDSRSDLYATSFSVNVDPTSEKFGHYQCFRAACLAHGVIDSDFMYMIHLDKYEVEKDINKFISSRNNNPNNIFHSKSKKELYNVINTYSEIAEAKKNYINQRLGLKLSYEDLYKFKINLSLIDLLNINEISIPKDKIDYFTNLSNYGISFISAYNDYVIIRDISKNKRLKKRYTNIPIFGKDETISKAYCIPGSFDIMSPEPVVINISEGAFDILGVYHHMKVDKKYQNQIYLAACGAGIENTLKTFIREYGIINCKINIFADSDVDIKKFESLRKLKPYFVKFDIRVFYNTLEKDFGVPKNRIKAIQSKI